MICYGIAIQPIDRYYNKHNKQREDRIEILSDKFTNTVLSSNGSGANLVLEMHEANHKN